MIKSTVDDLVPSYLRKLLLQVRTPLADHGHGIIMVAVPYAGGEAITCTNVPPNVLLIALAQVIQGVQNGEAVVIENSQTGGEKPN